MQGVHLDHAHVAQVIETMPHTLQPMHNRHTKAHLVNMASVIALVCRHEACGNHAHFLQILRAKRQHGFHHRVTLVEQALNVSACSAYTFIRERGLTVAKSHTAQARDMEHALFNLIARMSLLRCALAGHVAKNKVFRIALADRRHRFGCPFASHIAHDVGTGSATT